MKYLFLLSLLLFTQCHSAYSQKRKANEAVEAVLSYFHKTQNERYLNHFYLYNRSASCVKLPAFTAFLAQEKRFFSGLEFHNIVDECKKGCKESEKVVLTSEKIKNFRLVGSFKKKLSELDTLYMGFLSHPIKVRKHLYYIELSTFIFANGEIGGNELITCIFLYDTKTNEMIYPENGGTQFSLPEYCDKVKEFERLPDLKKLFNNEKYMCW